MKLLKNKTWIVLSVFLFVQQSFAQNNKAALPLPVYVLPAAGDTAKPMIVYITGDGGWNKFSKTLCSNLAAKGYPIAALDAKEYFWKKKTPAQSALDITRLIEAYQKIFNRKKIVLLGYSFGAEVLPFVFNGLPGYLKAQVINVSMVSPSAYTDFEIHIAVMLGAGFTGGASVTNELNKITAKPVTLIFGMDENEFPLSQVKIKYVTCIRLQGGHHYDGDEAKLCNTIIQYFPLK